MGEQNFERCEGPRDNGIHARHASVLMPPAKAPTVPATSATHTPVPKKGGAPFPLKGTYDALEDALLSVPDVKFAPLGYPKQSDFVSTSTRKGDRSGSVKWRGRYLRQLVSSYP